MAKGKPSARNARRINVWSSRAMSAQAAASHGVKRAGRLTVYRTKDDAKAHGHATTSRRRKPPVEEAPKVVAEAPEPAKETPSVEAPPRRTAVKSE